ncbi:maturase-related protein [Escherichia coli]|nr:maturase-related protein [Escherichia coli]
MDIPKPDGGVRTSGIPTVVDRLIQQAVQQAQRYIRGGKRWVVDMDLEKFFDRVDHRLLMTPPGPYTHLRAHGTVLAHVCRLLF